MESSAKEVIDTVIQEAIGKETIDGIFKKVDRLCKGQKVDIIIGGPPCQAYSIAGRARLGKKLKMIHEMIYINFMWNF